MTTKTDDCNCKDQLFAEGDDDRMKQLILNAVIPALTPQKFVVTLEVHAIAPLDVVRVLLDQYRSIKDVPVSQAALEEIESELRDIASTLENLSDLICEDITSLFDEDEPIYSNLINARLLGIQTERSIVVKDS